MFCTRVAWVCLVCGECYVLMFVKILLAVCMLVVMVV